MKGSYDLKGNNNKGGTEAIAEYYIDYENACGACMEEKDVIKLAREKKENEKTIILSLMKKGKSIWKRKAD